MATKSLLSINITDGRGRFLVKLLLVFSHHYQQNALQRARSSTNFFPEPQSLLLNDEVEAW